MNLNPALEIILMNVGLGQFPQVFLNFDPVNLNFTLSELIYNYRSNSHPICGPLIRGGPAELAKELGMMPETGYIDECHFCYLTRRRVIGKFSDFLSPKQVYGLD